MDLLIDLIEKRKLLVNDISLASVTDDYMRYVAQFDENPLRDMAEFIVLAATLLLLKSKSLLPILELTDAEEENIESLEKRLRYYQIFRNSGKIIFSVFGKRMLYERPWKPVDRPIFLADRFTTVGAMRDAMGEVVRNLPTKEHKPRVQVKSVITLEAMIERLLSRIEKQFVFKFKEFTGDGVPRTTVIVGFLAVLEMVKQGRLLVKQAMRFEDIEIERKWDSAPRYQ